MKLSELIHKLQEQGIEAANSDVAILNSGEWGWQSPRPREPRPGSISDVVTVDKLGTVYLISES